jgi:hypothetical protein
LKAFEAPPAPRLHVYLFILLALGIIGCQNQTVSTSPVPSPLPMTPTATLSFPTLVPTPTEGAAQPPDPITFPLTEAGRPTYSADFGRVRDWEEANDALGAVSYLGNTLSIVVPLPGTTRYVPSPAEEKQDFLLDASLGAVLCSGDDEYGVAFRYTPEADYLRFTVTCQGGIRLRQVRAGSSRAVVPFLETSQAARPGAPVSNRFTVVAHGQEISLWLNGSFLFQVQDPAPAAGGLGLVVSSSQRTPHTTVQVHAFSVYPPVVVPTAIPSPTESSDE